MKPPKLIAIAVGLLIFLWPIIDPAIARELLEKEDVFLWHEGGYQVVRIPGIVVSSKGTALAYAEARHHAGDWGDIEIVLRRSTDGGKSWGPLQVLEDGAKYANDARNVVANRKSSESHYVTCNNPVMIVDRQEGIIHFLNCIEYGRCFYRRSTDDGSTFSEPVEITNAFEGFRPEYNWKVLATGPGHGIQLTNGRLVVPIWLSSGQGSNGHRPSCVSTIYSDDHGSTWKPGQIVVNHPELTNPSETTAVQLSDGRVMLNIRSESKEHRRAISYSSDGATGWTKPVFDAAIYEPICEGSILRISQNPPSDRNRLLYVHPDPIAMGDREGSKSRKNLVAMLSYDNGQTWPVSKSIELGPSSYSDVALGSEGAIYCLYERSGAQGTSGSIAFAKFDIAWLTDGKDN